jgi:hypothetical protein
LPTLDDAAPAKPTGAENHATAIIDILNRAASATAGHRYRRALTRKHLFKLKLDPADIEVRRMACSEAPRHEVLVQEEIDRAYSEARLLIRRDEAPVAT